MNIISLFSIVTLTTISLFGCGVVAAIKSDECNSIGKITEDIKAAADKIETATASKNFNAIVQSFITVSDKTDKLGKKMKALN